MQLAEEIYSQRIAYRLACGHYALRNNAWSLKRPLPEQRPNAECAAQPSFFVPVFVLHPLLLTSNVSTLERLHVWISSPKELQEKEQNEEAIGAAEEPGRTVCCWSDHVSLDGIGHVQLLFGRRLRHKRVSWGQGGEAQEHECAHNAGWKASGRQCSGLHNRKVDSVCCSVQ